MRRRRGRRRALRLGRRQGLRGAKRLRRRIGRRHTRRARRAARGRAARCKARTACLGRSCTTARSHRQSRRLGLRLARAAALTRRPRLARRLGLGAAGRRRLRDTGSARRLDRRQADAAVRQLARPRPPVVERHQTGERGAGAARRGEVGFSVIRAVQVECRRPRQDEPESGGLATRSVDRNAAQGDRYVVRRGRKRDTEKTRRSERGPSRSAERGVRGEHNDSHRAGAKARRCSRCGDHELRQRVRAGAAHGGVRRLEHERHGVQRGGVQLRPRAQ